MVECWHTNPEVRCNALRLKKSVAALMAPRPPPRTGTLVAAASNAAGASSSSYSTASTALPQYSSLNHDHGGSYTVSFKS